MGRLCNFSLAILTQTQQDKYTECWWPDDSPCWNSGKYLPICCVSPKGSHVRLGYKPRVLLVWWSPQVVVWGEKTGTGQCCWDASAFLCVWQPSSSPHVIAMVFCLVIGLKAMDGADLTWTGTPELNPQDSFFFFLFNSLYLRYDSGKLTHKVCELQRISRVLIYSWLCQGSW